MSTLSLFDDGPPSADQSGSLVRRSTTPGDSKKAKAVNRLLAQVESLRERFDEEKRRLDEALIFHAAQVRPRRERVLALRTEIVRMLAPFLDGRHLSKADKRVLRAILMEQVDEILAHAVTPEPEVKDLFERLHGMGFDEAVQHDLDDARSDMADFFAAIGLDMDVPDLRPGMTEEELAASAAQMADRMRQVHEAQVERVSARRRTKRELREEQRAERHEQVRKISIGAVYKRLVKALHPDLEPDSSLRQRKSAVMQEVTAAHAGNDLHTLLRLELEWIDGEGPDGARKTDETLNAYAEVLRQQVAQLRAETMELPLHPRYQELMADDLLYGSHRLIDGPFEVRRLDAVIDGLAGATQRLSDEAQSLREVRELIRLHGQERGRRSRIR